MKWPHRFRQYCDKIIEDMDSEWELYKLYREKGDKFIYEMCYAGKDKDCVRFPTEVVPKQPNTEL
jgi:hypothetical protein